MTKVTVHFEFLSLGCDWNTFGTIKNVALSNVNRFGVNSCIA